MNELPLYSKILKAEFDKRKNTNRRYSIRAFAQLLNVSYSTLSLLLRGKVGLSKSKAVQIAKRLALSPEESRYFAELVVSESGRSSKERTEAKLRLKQYSTRFNARSLDTESFQLISDWYSFPIMELVRIHGPEVNPSFLARKLGIPTIKVRQTLQNFRNLELIKNGVVVSDFISLPDGPADSAAQKFHTSLLEKAKRALLKPKEERNVTAQVIRMRKSDLKWAAQELRDLRRKLASRLEEGTEHDSIFSISVQWVRLDRDL